MLNETQSQSCDNSVLARKALPAQVNACPLCSGQWVSLGGLSKCVVCGFILCEGCGEGSLAIESR
jgi:Zn-finger nucleic acid-binding protein